MSMNKNVCYTCIVGNYDTLKDPAVISENFDYICYTDNPKIKSNIWEIKPIDDIINKYSNNIMNRFIKWLPYIFLSDYEFSIYVDGSIKVLNDLNEFKNKYCNDPDILMYLIPHNKRNYIYEEFLANAYGRKEEVPILYNQMKKYLNENLPDNYLLTHNCMLFRYHNKHEYIDIGNNLWKEMSRTTFRDQLSLPYIIWKLDLKDKIKLINPGVLNKYFDYNNSWNHDMKYDQEKNLLNDVIKYLKNNNYNQADEFIELINKMFKSYM